MGKELEQYRDTPKKLREDMIRYALDIKRKRQAFEAIGRSKAPFGVVLRGEVVVGFDVTRRFFQRALREGAHQSRIPGRGERNLEIVRQYIETEDTLKDIGKRHGIVHQAVSQIIRRELVNLWLNCPDKTQRLFPLEYIRLSKPLSATRREHLMRFKYGGIISTVTRMIEEGAKYEEIYQLLGSDAKKYYRLRQTLKRWGLELPLPTYGEAKKQTAKVAEELAKPGLDDGAIQNLLDQVPYSLYSKGFQREIRLVLSIGQLTVELGWKRPGSHTPKLAGVLEAAGIPLTQVTKEVKSGRQAGTHRYYLIAAQHKERAQEILRKYLGISYPPSVRQISGPESAVQTHS